MRNLFTLKKLLSIAMGAWLMANFSGCSSPSQLNLAPAHNDMRIVYLNETKMVYLSKSDPTQLHATLETMREHADLTDNIHTSVKQMLARGALYGEKWPEYFSQQLTFYVEGIEQLQPRKGIEVRDAAGRLINNGYQVIPADHLLQINLSLEKRELQDDLAVSIALADGGSVQFTLDTSSFTTNAIPSY